MILLSSMAQAADLAAGRAAGADYYLTKPFSPLHLVRTVDEAARAHHRAGRAPRRVLVVEDDEAVRAVLAEALASAGYTVDQAEHGAEALERVRRQVPDLMLVDLMLPVMDGETFLRRCRAEGPCAGVPVVVLSAAHALPEVARTLDVRTSLAKPFDLDVLLGIVDHLTSDPRGRAPRGEHPGTAA